MKKILLRATVLLLVAVLATLSLSACSSCADRGEPLLTLGTKF